MSCARLARPREGSTAEQLPTDGAEERTARRAHGPNPTQRRRREHGSAVVLVSGGLDDRGRKTLTEEQQAGTTPETTSEAIAPEVAPVEEPATTVAGSSTGATSGAIASEVVSGVVPACCSSVKVFLPLSSSPPETRTTAEPCSRRRRWVGFGPCALRAVRSSAPSVGSCSAVEPSRGRASLAHDI